MKLLAIDGNSIVNRAFYGVKPLNAPDGTPTNAIFGFYNIVQKVYSEIEPDAMCVAFDMHAPTFRHKAYYEYKAGRRAMPDDLKAQMPILKQCLDAFGIRYIELAGYEADDIIGTLAAKCEESGNECCVLTGDKDSLQLISDCTSVGLIRTSKGKSEVKYYKPENFADEYGFKPERMIDLKALMGDASDNIPGVNGIGEVTAGKLISSFGSLKAVYDNINDASIKESVRAKLAAGRESAEFSLWLATIFKFVPLNVELSELSWHYRYNQEIESEFTALGFNKFLEKLRTSAVINELDAANEASETAIVLASADAVSELTSKVKLISMIFRYDTGIIELSDGNAIYTINILENGKQAPEMIKALFSSDTFFIVAGLKQTVKYLRLLGADPESASFFDSELAAYVLNSVENDYSVRHLADKYQLPTQPDAVSLYLLYDVLKAEIEDKELTELYYKVELPLCFVLESMERIGFMIDKTALTEFGELLTEKIKVAENTVYEIAGHAFNVNSPKQLGTVLFEEMGLPYGKKTKTGWKTDADIIQKVSFVSPIGPAILEYRNLSKLKSTYADGLIKFIDSDSRIRTNFQMTVTATGRLSSTEPNLQNIPIRKKLGAEVRKMFVATPGHVLIDADYSQIELRLLAHISGDENLQNAFLVGNDFHTMTASAVFHVSPEDVTPQLRSNAKAINFGIVYGMSSYTLSEDIGVSPFEAKQYINSYFETYPKVADYLDNVVREAEKNGYVKTIFGRKRYLPELKSSNHNVKAFGERVAMNMPIQGTAADVIKIAMVNVYSRLKNEFPDSHLIMQVHDELIIECPECDKLSVSAVIKEEMENACRLSVPLLVDVETGYNWLEAH